jgi:RNA polymerase sigma factor (sigma-70 family)
MAMRRILLCCPAVVMMLARGSSGWASQSSSEFVSRCDSRESCAASARSRHRGLPSVARLGDGSQLFAADSTASSSSWSSRGRKEESRKKSTRTNDDLAATVGHNSILEDSVGRVNRDLAERIWNWEQERRDSSQLPRLEYSVRSGLKLVSKLAAELRQLSKFANRVSDPSDLVQEGLVALLDAIGSYPGSDPAEFERFASQRIQESLTRSLQQHDTTSPSPLAGMGAVEEVIPRQSLPRSVQRTLQRAQQVAKELTGPRTLSRIASAMDMSPERLRDCIELASSVRRQDQIGTSDASVHRPSRQHRQSTAQAFPKAMLSFESTVEISNPQLQDSVEYRDQDEWELWQGLLLDDGRGSIRRDELVEDFVDETLHDEGDDDSWIRHQQNAGRLQDLIPDTSTETNERSRSGSGFGLEPSVDDDMALVELIRGDLSSFLSDTLTKQEQQIVQMAFGLTESREPPTSQSRIAAALGLDKGVVSKALAQAIDKLRVAYHTRYVEPYSDDNDDLIDSV